MPSDQSHITTLSSCRSRAIYGTRLSGLKGIDRIGDGERSRCCRRSNSYIGGANVLVKAHCEHVSIGECGIPPVQKEGSEPGEMPRQRPTSHSLRPLSA
ncbi:hypothetical protein SDJN03_25676, partial [Cucurbita argyrosperma subsp. sororia]